MIDSLKRKYAEELMSMETEWGFNPKDVQSVFDRLFTELSRLYVAEKSVCRHPDMDTILHAIEFDLQIEESSPNDDMVEKIRMFSPDPRLHYSISEPVYEYQYYMKEIFKDEPYGNGLSSYMTDEIFDRMPKPRSVSYTKILESRRVKQ